MANVIDKNRRFYEKYVAETFLYLDALALLLSLGCKAWLLFDCFYYKEAEVKGKYDWTIEELLRLAAKKLIS